MRRRRLIVTTLIVAALTLGCALKYQSTAVKLAVAVEQTLGGFQDATRLTCDSMAQPMTPLKRCSAQGEAIGMTTERFRIVSGKLAVAFTFMHDRLVPALRLWGTGIEAAKVYREFYTLVDDAVRSVRTMITPTTTTLWNALQSLTNALGSLGDKFTTERP